MNQVDLISQLQMIFNDVFHAPVTLTPETEIRKLKEWDWITHAYFIIAIENKFSVNFRVNEEEQTQNIGEFANLILEKMKQKKLQKT
jgi:acyl carrier protein